AGIVGIFIDSLAEKQIQKWREARSTTSRRRGRIVTRIIVERRKRSAEKSHIFIGGYLTRALADERVRRAESANKEGGTADGRLLETQEDQVDDHATEHEAVSKNSLKSVVMLGVSMPVLAKLGLLFALSTVCLRTGAVTFGGGYVMIPLIESEVVDKHHWLTHQEFADATALGQVTPGPVLITATFIGYRVAGTLGALVATISIFLPSFLMVIAAATSFQRFRSNGLVQSFLRGVTPAVVGLLVAAAISIGQAGIHTW